MNRLQAIVVLILGLAFTAVCVIASLPAYAADSALPVFLLEYTTSEKCYECNVRTAMVCIPSTPDCNVPSKTVHHWLEFRSVGEALKFINTPPAAEVWTVTPPPPAGGERTLVRILMARELPVEKTVAVVSEPRPPVSKEIVTYKAK